MLHGLGNGAFEDGEEEVSAIVEEFYPEAEDSQADAGGGASVNVVTAIVGEGRQRSSL